ncbi:MAG TPA: DNA polymerase I [Patescibacteria group bacterium]|jgi:DNA polymerase-1|nr:DNA polymerase I [Patescibacteria group bacterium]
MTKRLVIIDGKSVFYRGYYAMPNLSTSDGTPTGGVYGFAMMALEVIKRLKPDYVCVAWDKAKTNIRSRLLLYPEYKGNRKPAPPDFYVQIPILHDLLESLGWPLYELDDYEADDIMGAFAKQAGEQDVESYLISSDLDILQLINSHTHIYTLKKGLSNIELFNEAYFKEKYGIDPSQFVDLKALKGDASDNIPGVAGIGEKTALELLKKYQTLDGVYEHLDYLKPALRSKLQEGKTMAYLSKQLVTLMVDAPITIDLKKAELHEGLRPEFVAMLRKLEFRALLNKVESELPKSATREAEAEFANKKFAAAKIVPYKAEDFKSGKPRVIAMDLEFRELWASAKPGNVSVVSIQDLNKDLIAQLANGPTIGHDLKPIFRALLANDIAWPGVVGHDTRIAAFLLNSLIRVNELSDILKFPLDSADPKEVVMAIWQVYQDQAEQLSQLPKLSKLAQDIEFPTIYLLAKIEHQGILLNSQYLHDMGDDFAEKIKNIEQKIYELAGQEFNIASPQQLGTILFEKLQLPTFGVKKGKTGYSTGAKELDKLRDQNPIINLITEYREYTKLKSTYIDTLPTQVDKQGRLHTNYMLDVAATGRLSSINPNLQNIPTRTDIGLAIRKAFVPAKGNVFVSADYNQFELRLAAVLANDKELISDFNNHVDVHAKTAAQIYGVPLDQVTKTMRRHAKVINFGILYGMSPHGLSAATGMNFVEAKEFISKYFELRASIREYIDKTVEQALENGYVETLFGRRRPTPDLKSSNFIVREAGKRAAMNMPIQGTEADLMKMAMLEVEKKLDGYGQQLLQIHDSILVECPAANAEKVSKILKDTMENIYPLSVQLDVDVTVGKNWGEL